MKSERIIGSEKLEKKIDSIWFSSNLLRLMGKQPLSTNICFLRVA